MKYDRMRRVDELLRREIGRICERDIVPELSSLLTITQVKTAPDLRHAQVFFSVFGPPDEQTKAYRLLNRKRAQMQKEVGSAVQLKYTPVLHFKVDHTPEQADRVLSILDELDLSDVPDAAKSPDDGSDMP